MTKKNKTKEAKTPDNSDVKVTHGTFAGMTVAEARKALKEKRK
jgi:hypothetical protein